MNDALDRDEARVTALVAGKWEAEVATFRRSLLALWSANGQSVTAAQVRALAKRLDTSPAAVDAAKALMPAARLGDARVSAKTKVRRPSPATLAALDGAQEKPREAVAEVRRRAAALDLTTLSGVLGVLGPLGRSANEMKGAASWAVQTAANEATIAAAAEDDTDIVFVPERDACLRCIERAGQVGDAVRASPPPVHPHCRCEVEPYTDPAVPKALAREGVRSVLRGFSLPSESEAERLRAAKAMLAKGPKAPKSVKDYAAASIKKGEFGRGRKVPGTR